MRNIITTVLAAVAVVCMKSCTIKDSEHDSFNDEIGVLSDNLVEDVIVFPVKVLSECAAYRDEIFKPGFETTSSGCYVKLLSARDSTWSVSNAVTTDRLTFCSTVKMLPDSPTGLHQWECSGEGTYIESSAYMATLETVTPAVMIWEESRSSFSLSYDLCMSGTFRVTTFLRGGGGLDCCTITYDGAVVDDYRRKYDISVEPIY